MQTTALHLLDLRPLDSILTGSLEVGRADLEMATGYLSSAVSSIDTAVRSLAGEQTYSDEASNAVSVAKYLRQVEKNLRSMGLDEAAAIVDQLSIRLFEIYERTADYRPRSLQALRSDTQKLDDRFNEIIRELRIREG